jgi:hypothetical protein
MNMIKKHFTVILLLVFPGMINAYSQLSDTKTIGGSSPDYATLSDAISALVSQGISGPVVFNIRAGTYNEQITIPYISNVSSTNTITFESESGDSVDVILTYTPTGSSDNFTVKLDGADYITFRNMTLSTGGTEYSNILLCINEPNNIVLNNNQFLGSTYSDITQGRAVYCYSDQAIQNYTIRNNLLKDGRRAVYFSADPANQVQGISILDNTFIDQSVAGISLINAAAPIVRKNKIQTSSTSGLYTGILCQNCSSSLTISKNWIVIPNTTESRGIFIFFSNGTSGNEGFIANNFIQVNSDFSGSQCSGIYFYSSSYHKVYHNSIHATGNYVQSRCLNILSGSSNIESLNNVFANFAGGYTIYSDANSGITSDYNDLFTSGTYIGYWYDANQPGLSDWQTASGQDYSSLSEDPLFFSSTDLHASNLSLQSGSYLSAVPDDIDGESRDLSTPCIGADEFIEGSLAGTYALGPSAPEFNTFNEAFNALINRGIRGPVVFQVESGTYNERCIVTEINGASYDQTVTFIAETGDSSDVILNYSPVDISDNGTLFFDGADHIIIKKMTLSSTGTDNAIVVYIANECHNLQFHNNHFRGVTSSGILEPLAVIYSGSYKDSNNLFQNNLFEAGSYGLYLKGKSSEHETGTRIIGNTFINQYEKGIYFKYQDGPKVEDNHFTTSSSNSAYNSIYLDNVFDDASIRRNHINLDNTVGGYGIYLYFVAGVSGKEGLIANNLISVNTSGNNCSGIYSRFSGFQKILHNNIQITGILANSSAVNLNLSNNDFTVLNNILSNPTGAYAIISDNTTNLISDRNDIYTTGTYLGSWDGANQSDLTAWQTASGQDANSVSVDPQFTSADDPHFPNPDLNDAGTPVAEVTDDIDGEMRDPTTPDIGADEFSLPPEADNVFGCTTRNIPNLTAVGDSIRWYSDGALSTMVHSGNNFPTGHTAAGDYTYYVTQTVNESESQADTVTLSINTTPGLPSATDETICFGESTPDLTATGTDIKWYDDEAMTNMVHTGTPFSTEETESGTYTYYVTQTQDGCESNPDTSVLTIHSIPAPPENELFISCFGDTVPDLVATGENIKWYSDEELTKLIHVGDTFSSGDTLSEYYAYYPTQTVFGCESGPGYDTLWIKPRPDQPLADSQSVCIGENVPDLTASGTDIKWYEDTERKTLLHSGNTFSTGETEIGVYPYFATQTVDGCESLNKTVALAINGLPVPDILEDQVICEVDTQEFQLSATTAAGHSYSWTSSQGDLTSSEANPVVKPIAPGSYEYFLTETIDSTGCLDKDTVTITINPDPMATVLADQVLCRSEIRGFQLGASAITGNSYSWVSNPAGFVNAEANPTVTPTESVTYVLTETIDLTGCHKTDSVTFTINPNPDATVLDDQTICHSEVQPFSLGAAAVSGNSYSWTSSQGDLTSPEANPVVEPSEPGTYKYFLVETIDATGCDKSDSVTIVINPNPVVSITADKDTIDRDSSTILNASGAQSYLWGPAAGLSSTTESQVTADPDEITTYIVEGTNIFDCTATDTITLYVYCPECGDENYFTATGSFNFGCTNNLYKNNLNCSWTILPSGVDSIHLNFKSLFDIKSGDYIKVYNGSDATASLIGSYNNDNLPPELISSGSTMFIEFITDDHDTGLGFQARWSNDPKFTGIDDISENRIRIYPNPVNDKLFVEIDDLTGKDLRLFIYNQLGKMILNCKLENSGGQIREEMDISDFKAGIYYIKIVTSEVINVQKVVKE